MDIKKIGENITEARDAYLKKHFQGPPLIRIRKDVDEALHRSGWVKTGHFFKYSDEARNIHERTVPLWELNDKADLTPYRVPPREKP